MKFNIYILLITCLFSCKSQSNLSTEIKEPIVQNAVTTLKGYESTISLIPNKTIEFKQDKFNSVYVVESDGPNFILKYELKKNQDPQLPDSRYSEILYAELPADFKEILLNNGELQTIKLHTAKFCFCENANSYEPITTGVFEILKGQKNTFELHIDFIPKKSSFKVTSIKEVIYVK